MSSRPLPPPPPRVNGGNGAPAPTRQRTHVAFAPIADAAGHRIVLYGPGGIGKTTLAAHAPGPVAVFDLDNSLPRLRASLADCDLRIVPAYDWQAIRDALASPGWDEIKTILIDTLTRGEELDVDWTIRNVPHEKGNRIVRIEDYGYGKGYQHVYDVFLTLLGDLDQHAAAGRNVILICHDCTSTVPNPHGEDWIRYEPRLQSPSSGKSSIRLRVREWADHVFFMGYDVDVKGGKGRGSGTRTLWPTEYPHCMAKSRTLADPIPIVAGDYSLWTKLFAE